MKHTHAPQSRGSPRTQAYSGVRPPHRILVADDEKFVRDISTQALIDSGYHVDAAEDGAAAWESLQIRSYDLLVTDNRMPKVTGMELLQKLKDFGMPIAVIMATGTSPETEFLRRPWLQPTVVLLKPFTPEELVKTVETVLTTLPRRERT